MQHLSKAILEEEVNCALSCTLYLKFLSFCPHVLLLSPLNIMNIMSFILCTNPVSPFLLFQSGAVRQHGSWESCWAPRLALSAPPVPHLTGWGAGAGGSGNCHGDRRRRWGHCLSFSVPLWWGFCLLQRPWPQHNSSTTVNGCHPLLAEQPARQRRAASFSRTQYFYTSDIPVR